MAHDQLNIISYCDTVAKKAGVVQVCVRKQICKDERSYGILLFVSDVMSGLLSSHFISSKCVEKSES